MSSQRWVLISIIELKWIRQGQNQLSITDYQNWLWQKTRMYILQIKAYSLNLAPKRKFRFFFLSKHNLFFCLPDRCISSFDQCNGPKNMASNLFLPLRAFNTAERAPAAIDSPPCFNSLSIISDYPAVSQSSGVWLNGMALWGRVWRRLIFHPAAMSLKHINGIPVKSRSERRGFGWLGLRDVKQPLWSWEDKFD